MNTTNFKTYILFKIMVLAVLTMLIRFVPSAYALNFTVSQSSLSSPGPYPGSDPLGELFGVHPNVKNNVEIMNFIDMHGLRDWYGKPAGFGHGYVYLLPEENYSKKLVFLYNSSGKWADDSIIWVKLIDLDEELPRLNESEARLLGIIGNDTHEIKTNSVSANSAPGFMPVAAIAAIVLSLSMIKTKGKFG
ncbi:hypothetical protein [Methanocella conradii]|uniref:hypothetical protein n=1 Tax=Methanocella conradii TaxID=1175444 RepID=UPI0024B3766D|nr:hypothetical protein [Methanocella conradii]MDI6898028.1 hypothetical protein [Methanocella conradii]